MKKGLLQDLLAQEMKDNEYTMTDIGKMYWYSLRRVAEFRNDWVVNSFAHEYAKRKWYKIVQQFILEPIHG